MIARYVKTGMHNSLVLTSIVHDYDDRTEVYEGRMFPGEDWQRYEDAQAALDQALSSLASATRAWDEASLTVDWMLRDGMTHWNGMSLAEWQDADRKFEAHVARYRDCAQRARGEIRDILGCELPS